MSTRSDDVAITIDEKLPLLQKQEHIIAVETVSISEAHSVTRIKTGAYHRSRNGEYIGGTLSN